jgi:hypothetical protein
MASGINTNPLSTIKTDSILFTAKLVGTGAGTALAVADPTAANSEIVSITFVSTGIHDVVLRRSFPQLLSLFPIPTLGTTVGLSGNWVSFDPVAKTARIRLTVGNAVTDAAATDNVFLNWVVRNSGKNT